MFVVLDTETTGLYAAHNEIISFAGIKVDQELREIDRLVIKIKPRHPDRINKDAQRLNGYHPRAWQNACEPNEAAERICNFLDGCIPVAHNWAFDRSFILALIKSCNIKRIIPRRGIDTISLSMAAFKRYGQRSFSMQAMCDLLGWPEQPHRAEADAILCLALFRLLYPNNIKTTLKIKTVWYISKVRKFFNPI
jgi:DNA polymerase III alpha subunit (gram-positive type)